MCRKKKDVNRKKKYKKECRSEKEEQGNVEKRNSRK